MGFLLSEHYRTARQSLDRARLRTLLTITGVAIGVASITSVLALADGVNKVIGRQVAELGSSIAVVRPRTDAPTLADLSNPTPRNAYATSPLEERDLDSLAELPETDAVAPLMTISGSVRTRSASAPHGTILATTPSFESLAKLTVADGQFIDSVTTPNTAVVGAQLAIDLFGTDQAIGKTFLIKGQSFTIIGVLKRQNTPINYNNVDLDYAAIIGLESGKLFNSGVAAIQQINILAKPGTDMPKFASAISRLLRQNHGGERDSQVFIGKKIARPTSDLFRFISTTMAVVAAISLFVGGIGIMNIMLVGVSERTREIGLRKAVGASSLTIVSQFLIEALIISGLGGVIGFGGGYFAAFVVSLFIPYDPSFAWSILGWALALAVGVGVVFGLYPAIRAARKDPIESLRRYH
jgi:ABC-type antimicrobial peptide transport system permease subunit